MYQDNTNQRKVRAMILILNKADFKAKEYYEIR